MKNRPRGGLGRGLGALIPTAPPAGAATDGGGAAAPRLVLGTRSAVRCRLRGRVSRTAPAP